MTVKCPVRIRLQTNFTIEGLIVTIERGSSQFEFNYRLAVLLDRFSHKTTLIIGVKAVHIIIKIFYL